MNLQIVQVKKKDNRIVHLAAATTTILLLRATLDYTFLAYVKRYFAGQILFRGFSVEEINIFRILESYALMLLLGAMLSNSLYNRSRPSGIISVLYFSQVLIPLTSLYGLIGAPRGFIYAASCSFIVLITLPELLPMLKVPKPIYKLSTVVSLLLIVMSLYVYTTLSLSGGLNRLNFDLLRVYEVRANFIQTRGMLMSYLVPWQAAINTALFAYALYRKRYILIALTLFAQVLLFGMTGNKSYFFSLAIAWAIYIIWRKRNSIFYFFCGATILILISYISFLLSGNHLAPSILIRRSFFVPAINHLIFYDFFSDPHNPFVMLSNSIFAPFINYPYPFPLVRVISWAYWNRDFSPNVGYLGDAFAQFGYIGMFLFSAILAIFCHFIDYMGRRFPMHLVGAMLTMPAIALVNSALFTTLLTHGFILTIFIIWILQDTNYKSKKLKAHLYIKPS